jgi:hypothetical protein
MAQKYGGLLIVAIGQAQYIPSGSGRRDGPIDILANMMVPVNF